MITSVGRRRGGGGFEERTSDPVDGWPQKEGVRVGHLVEPRVTGLDLVPSALIGCVACCRCKQNT